MSVSRLRLPRGPLLIAVAGAVSWIVAALLLYHPHVARPFDVVDFPSILTVFRAEGTFPHRFQSLIATDFAQGRARLLEYSLFALKWSLFGESTVAWQLASAAQMFAFAGMLFLQLRRWGATRLGSACATTLVLCSHVAAEGWMRLSISEAVGATLMLAAINLATRIEGSRHWMRLLLAISGIVAAMLFMKEMYVATMPAIWFSGAASDAHGALRVPKISKRSVQLGVCLAIVCFLILAPMAFIALSSPSEAYARHFGRASLSVGTLFAYYAGVVVPFVPATFPVNAAVLLADLAFLLLLLIGWKLLLSEAESKQPLVTLLWFALALPLLCALAYLPWPEFKLRYGIPYLLGPAILVSFAVTGVQRSVPRMAWCAVVAWAVVTVYMASEAHRYARRVEASLGMMAQLSRTLERLPAQDSVLYSVCDVPVSAWEGISPIVEKYARSEGARVPDSKRISCDDGRARAAQVPRTAVIVFVSDRAQSVSQPRQSIVYVANRFDWSALTFATDTVRADIAMMPQASVLR